ncbi:TIGR00341 family protein [Chitinivibrio alkaliphilus]|uniref:TIGR00341 family protein n=1 Tax=Chitinivibrio alkaliphilus ACht1 TaxID=1313304 RepID=U7DAZ6_9BACT|nr:TIGR00341 family protein [Chitinivibrio alkaliphilus]ERP38743.1 hypothetical protein CALK_0762 [Chitinivibrio alkaliphilus ACht1]
MWHIISEEEQYEYIREQTGSLHEAYSLQYLVFEETIQLPQESRVLLFLPDAHIKKLLPHLIDQHCVVSVLPHPEAREAALSLGVHASLEKEINHIQNAPDPITMDILYCNDIPVFNALIIGRGFPTSSNNSKTKLQLSHLFRLFNSIPFQVNIAISDDKELTTAATGVIISQHRKSTILSRLILEDSTINDDRMFLFIIAPRSIGDICRVILRSFLQKNRLPSFGGIIKSTKATLSFPQGEREFTLDKESYREKSLSLRVEAQAIRMIPGSGFDRNMLAQSEGTNVYKVQNLPSPEVAQALSTHRLPLIRRASTDEFRDLFQILRNNATLHTPYIVLIVLSTLLATLGLFTNSVPVVIGAMILAPLMGPIISLSMGVLRQDKKLTLSSVTTIGSSVCMSLGAATLLTYFMPLSTPGTEILSRTHPTLLDLGIAAISGCAGAYAHAREDLAKTLAGVAIAVALIPPLAVTGIGIGWGRFDIFGGAALLFTTNLAGITLAAALTFLVLGFSPIKRSLRGMAVSLTVVALLSIPLAMSFHHTVSTQRMIRNLEKKTFSVGMLRNVQVETNTPLTLSFRLVHHTPPTADDLSYLQNSLEEILHTPLSIEVTPTISPLKEH